MYSQKSLGIKPRDSGLSCLCSENSSFDHHSSQTSSTTSPHNSLRPSALTNLLRWCKAKVRIHNIAGGGWASSVCLCQHDQAACLRTATVLNRSNSQHFTWSHVHTNNMSVNSAVYMVAWPSITALILFLVKLGQLSDVLWKAQEEKREGRKTRHVQ